MKWACQGGYLVIIKLLAQQIPPTYEEYNTSLNYYCRRSSLFHDCTNMLITFNHSNSFKWFYQNYKLYKYSSHYFCQACKSGDLEICKYIDEIDSSIKLYRYDNKHLPSWFNDTCKYGHYNIVKWAHENDAIKSDYISLCDLPMILCTGQLDLCKLLFSIDPIKFKNLIVLDMLAIFRKLINRKNIANNLHIMKWLYEICNNIDDCFLYQTLALYKNSKLCKNDDLFMECFYQQQLEIGQWLYSINPKFTDISINNNLITDCMIQWITDIKN